MSWLLDFLPWWTWYAVVGAVLAFTLPWWLPLAKIVWAFLPAWARFVLGGFLAALAAYLMGRNTGTRNERERQRERDARAEAQRRETNEEIERKPDDQVNKDLERWNRD